MKFQICKHYVAAPGEQEWDSELTRPSDDIIHLIAIYSAVIVLFLYRALNCSQIRSDSHHPKTFCEVSSEKQNGNCAGADKTERPESRGGELHEPFLPFRRGQFHAKRFEVTGETYQFNFEMTNVKYKTFQIYSTDWTNIILMLFCKRQLRVFWSNYYKRSDIWAPLLLQRPL